MDNRTREAKVICLSQNKGGSGKTTATLNIAACLVEQGYRVLAVDLDPQSNLTTGLNISLDDLPTAIEDLLLSDSTVYQDVLVQTGSGVDLLPARPNLEQWGEKSRRLNRDFILLEKLQSAKENYDYILLDTPPSLELLSVSNAFCASDFILIPMQLEKWCFDGLTRITEFLSDVQRHVNPKLALLGIFASRYDKRLLAQNQLLGFLEKDFKQKNLTPIHASVKISNAVFYKQPVITYEPKSESANEYRNLTKEVVHHASK